MVIVIPPEYERFVDECVASGEFQSATDVVHAAFEVLRELECERASFVASLENAAAVAERDGAYSVDQLRAALHHTSREAEASAG